MCVNLPFCFGDTVILTEAGENSRECDGLNSDAGIVMSVGVALHTPTSIPTCMISIQSNVPGSARQMLELSPQHTHFRTITLLFWWCRLRKRLGFASELDLCLSIRLVGQ